MPPLPSTPDILEPIRRRLHDIESYQLPRLRSCRGPQTLHAELGAELREALDEVGRRCEVAKVEVEDSVESRREREALRDKLEVEERRLGRARQDYRAALLHSKKAVDAVRDSQERFELLGAGDPTVSADEKLRNASTDDAVMSATNDVTSALRRTTALMQQELERSTLSVQLLDESTTTLRMTYTEHLSLHNLLDTSKRLISSLERGDVLDRLLILAALAFFLLCVAWIVKRRVVDRGVAVLGWGVGLLPGFGGRGGVGPVGLAREEAQEEVKEPPRLSDTLVPDENLLQPVADTGAGADADADKAHIDSAPRPEPEEGNPVAPPRSTLDSSTDVSAPPLQADDNAAAPPPVPEELSHAEGDGQEERWGVAETPEPVVVGAGRDEL